MELQVRRLDPDAPLPEVAHPGDAGLDLAANADLRLDPGERALVPTGIAVAVPEGYAGLVLPRSGLATRHGITLANAPGLIDSGYRGEVMLAVVNLDPRKSHTIKKGDRIAQLVVTPVEAVEVVQKDTLPASDRGEGGFGSTGR
jgi:dUTP pyrophosphatase